MNLEVILGNPALNFYKNIVVRIGSLASIYIGIVVACFGLIFTTFYQIVRKLMQLHLYRLYANYVRIISVLL